MYPTPKFYRFATHHHDTSGSSSTCRSSRSSRSNQLALVEAATRELQCHYSAAGIGNPGHNLTALQWQSGMHCCRSSQPTSQLAWADRRWFLHRDRSAMAQTRRPVTTPTRHCTTVHGRLRQGLRRRLSESQTCPHSQRLRGITGIHPNGGQHTRAEKSIAPTSALGAAASAEAQNHRAPGPGPRHALAGPLGRRPWLRLWHMLAPPCVESTRISLKGAGCSG
jgi:hypothetical protein